MDSRLGGAVNAISEYQDKTKGLSILSTLGHTIVNGANGYYPCFILFFPPQINSSFLCSECL